VSTEPGEVHKPRRLTFAKGDTVRFRVQHSAAEEEHLHGYDIAKDLPAGKTITFQFKADIEGIFEVELEHSGTWGAAAVLVVSFVALALAWPTPRLQQHTVRPLPDRLGRLLTSRALDIACGAVGVALLALTVWAGLNDSTDRPRGSDFARRRGVSFQAAPTAVGAG
jgi:hypothetical protein